MVTVVPVGGRGGYARFAGNLPDRDGAGALFAPQPKGDAEEFLAKIAVMIWPICVEHGEQNIIKSLSF